MGFSLRRLRLCREKGSSAQASVAAACGFSSCTDSGLVALWRVGSSQTRDQTHVPCIGRWICICHTTRQVPGSDSLTQNRTRQMFTFSDSLAARMGRLLLNFALVASDGDEIVAGGYFLQWCCTCIRISGAAVPVQGNDLSPGLRISRVSGARRTSYGPQHVWPQPILTRL